MAGDLERLSDMGAKDAQTAGVVTGVEDARWGEGVVCGAGDAVEAEGVQLAVE